MRNPIRHPTIYIVGLMILATIHSTRRAVAQTLWLSSPLETRLSLEFIKPSYADAVEVESSTFVAFATWQWRISDAFLVVTDLPLINFQLDESTSDAVSQTKIGNPYVGFTTRGQLLFLEFGTRIPINAGRRTETIVAGFLADWERGSAFTRDVVPIRAVLNLHLLSRAGLGTRLRLGYMQWLGNRGSEGAESFMLFGGFLRYKKDLFHTRIGVNGRWWINHRDTDQFDEAWLVEAGIAASLKLGALEPGVIVRVPVTAGLQDLLNHMIVITLAYGFTN